MSYYACYQVAEDEIVSLQERLAAYNFGASSDISEGKYFWTTVVLNLPINFHIAFISVLKLVFTSTGMETEEPSAPAEKKEGPKRRGAAKKKSSAIVLDDSDSDNEVHNVDDDDDDEDFEIMQPVAPGRKKGGRKPAAQNAKKAPAAASTKKRNVGGKQSQLLGQKLITDMLESTGISPEKKVRKMRASPFNKKSSSVLGRVAAADKDESVSKDLSGGSDASSSSPSITEEVVEIAPPAARARPQRANRRQTTYVLSESESDNDSDNEDYSDFEEDED